MNRIFIYLIAAMMFMPACSAAVSGAKEAQPGIELTLVPPTTITDKVELDIRAGVKNSGEGAFEGTVSIYLNSTDEVGLLHREEVTVLPGVGKCVAFRMNTAGKAGENTVILRVDGEEWTSEVSKKIEIIPSDIRSTRTIDGAWAGLYHWSEREGKHWNGDIKNLTDDDWRQVVRSMHKLGMDIIIVQELFRSEHWVNDRPAVAGSYDGLAFYPSKLYSGRMPLAAVDPLEAILTEADILGMHVFPGVGLYAWFDFTPASLEWHKKVASELWDMYGHHSSFYGFYVSEEIHGSLDSGEWTPELKRQRKNEVVSFFEQFKAHCRQLAPSKPIMLASNSMGVPSGLDTYPGLLRNLDILCPFGFARMPTGDLTGKEAADMLQRLCDEAGSHLWFDLEAFLFNEDGSLYPRDTEGIIADLTLLDNFEKVLCYQYPGVFNDPEAGFVVGEERTLKLFREYEQYYRSVRKPTH